jgi:hypothetical protein
MSAEPQRQPAPVRRLVLVVGIGRSGTSLLAGILGRLGFHVPQPEVRANDTNPRGFGEPRWVVDFHTRLMRERRVTVFDSRPGAWESTVDAAKDDAVFSELRSWLAVQFVGTDNVVVKDPRIGWFLPLWLRCARDLGVDLSFVTMLRYPTEVVSSARRWYGPWQTDASRIASWLNITLHTEQATRGARRAFVRYEDLVADWAREVSRCAELLDLPWLVGADGSRHPEVDAFVDPGLRREAVGWDELQAPSSLQALAEDVWRRVTVLAEPNGDNDAAREALDSALASYIQFYADAEAVAQSSLHALKRHPWSRTAGASRNDGRLPQVALLIPSRYRKRVQRSVQETLGGGSGLPLPLRLLLLVPPRYRERLPAPVLRAGHRFVRTLRR